MTPRAAIHRCIDQTRRAKDGRGAVQAERWCAARLGGSTIDVMAAAAARRLWEWLRTAHEGRPL